MLKFYNIVLNFNILKAGNGGNDFAGDIQNFRVLMIRTYNSLEDHRKHTTHERQASFYEVSYYLSGDGSVTINGTEYPIQPGYVRFVKPGDRVFSTVHFSCITINFELSSGTEPDEEQLFRSIDSYFPVRQDVGDLFCKILDLASTDKAGDRLLQYSFVLRLLSILCCEMNVPKHSEIIEKCISYMNENLSNHITLDDLGTVAGYSALHFRRLFLLATGLTPHAYLLELRLNRAKELLSGTILPIYSIAAKCGFRSSANFKTVFKKRMQITPGRFREEINNML